MPISKVLAPLFLLVLLMGCDDPQRASSTAPGGVSSGEVPVVVFLGDSLTAGPGLSSSEAYPAILQRMAAEAGYPHRFINAGVSGDTTADGVRRLDAALIDGTRVLVVALGANDGLRGFPVATVKRNLAEILEKAKARGISVLLAGMETPPSRGVQYSVEFHFIFPDLAREFKVPLMPFLLEGVFGNPDLNLFDGFHPNAAGMRVIASSMWPHLEPLLQETDPP